MVCLCKLHGREVGPRRAGDPPRLVASTARALQELGLRPEFPELSPIVETAWRWRREHAGGYGSRV